MTISHYTTSPIVSNMFVWTLCSLFGVALTCVWRGGIYICPLHLQIMALFSPSSVNSTSTVSNWLPWLKWHWHLSLLQSVRLSVCASELLIVNTTGFYEKKKAGALVSYGHISSFEKLSIITIERIFVLWWSGLISSFSKSIELQINPMHLLSHIRRHTVCWLANAIIWDVSHEKGSSDMCEQYSSRSAWASTSL